MGLGLAAVQNTLELHNLGYLKNSKNIFEIGSQELHLKKEDLKQLFDNAGSSDLAMCFIPAHLIYFFYNIFYFLF